MDEAEGGAGGVTGVGGAYNKGGDPGDQFHGTEAISAVADDGFLAEEDDDYEDLYNDVNVGEGFLQSLRKNEESKSAVVSDPQPPSESLMSVSVGEASGTLIPGVGGGEEGQRMGFAGSDSRVPAGSRSDGYQNQGLGGNNASVRGQTVPAVGDSTGPGPGGGGFGGGYGGGGTLRVELGQSSAKVADVGDKTTNNGTPAQGMGQHQSHGSGLSHAANDGVARQPVGGGSMNGTGGNIVGGSVVGAQAGATGAVGGGGAGGSSILFVGDLHWWTTDSELEAELVRYGPVKEVKFFDEKASGKSKGYCQVEFYDSAAASACKEGMNGHVFNGRSCVVAFASPYSVKRMGEAQVNKNQQPQTRRGPNDVGNKPGGNSISTGANYQGADNNRGYGRGNWGRGNAQMGNRLPVGSIRNRPGGMSGRGIMGNAGNGFGQGMGASMGATPPMMHPQTMMGQGFDPAFGGPMGRMGSFGGFPGGPAPPFQGMMPSFPPMGGVGLPGVAPHVNPAFFGRGMPMNGMGMMPNSGVDGPNMGMWSDPNMGGWTGDEHAGRAGESSFVDDAVSDHQYGEARHDRGGWSNSMKDKDKGAERDWSGSSDRRYKEDREPGYDRDMSREKDASVENEWSDRRHRDDRDVGRERDRERERSHDRLRERSHDRGRDRYRDDRDRYADHHRYRDREPEYDEEWDRGRSSRTHSKSRMEIERSRS